MEFEKFSGLLSLALVFKKMSFADFIKYSPFFLLFLGDIQIPIMGSSLYFPIALIPVIIIFLFNVSHLNISFSKEFFLITTVISFGFAGLVASGLSSMSRGIVGCLPLFYLLFVFIAYSKVYLDFEKAIVYVRAGVVVLFVQVAIKYLFAISTSLEYYESKLLIETMLGRSNFIAAFFIFGMMYFRVSIATALFFLAAVVFTMSRGGLLMISVFFAIIVVGKVLKLDVALRLLFFILCILVISTVFVFFDVYGYLQNTLLSLDVDARSSMNRIMLWIFSIEIIGNNLFFGIGPNSFRTLVEASPNIEDVWGAHNSILQLMLNYGLFGTFFYGCYIYLFLRTVSNAAKASFIKHETFYLKTGMFVLFIFSLFEPLVGSGTFELAIGLSFVLLKNTRVNEEKESNDVS